MTELFGDARAIDWILILVAIEAAALLGYRLVTGKGIAPASLLSNLGAGALLLLVIRGTLVGASPFLIGGLLALALAAHLTDLAVRWQGHT
jgi:hypothetical protein